MVVYIVLFALVLLGSLPDPSKRSNPYIFFVALLLFVLIGFRDKSVGVDTMSYVEDFSNYSWLNWKAVVRDALTHKEPVFHLICGALSRVSGNYTFYLCFWALFPAIALYSLFKNELKSKVDVTISVIVLFILGIYAFFVAGIRQTAAMSILLLSYRYLKRLDGVRVRYYLKNADLIKFAILLVLAFLLHNSSLVFSLALFARFIKVKWWFIFIPVGLFFIGNFVNAAQINYLAQFVFEETYHQYGTSYESNLSIAGFLMQLILFVICFLQKGKLIKENPDNQVLLVFALIALVFQSMVGIIAEMYRVSFYFGMFYLILVPRALVMYKRGPLKSGAYWAFILGSLFYLFVLSSGNLTEYSFVFYH